MNVTRFVRKVAIAIMMVSSAGVVVLAWITDGPWYVWMFGIVASVATIVIATGDDGYHNFWKRRE